MKSKETDCQLQELPVSLSWFDRELRATQWPGLWQQQASLEICIKMTNKNHAVQRSRCLVIGECGWIWTLSFVSVLVVDLAQFCTHAHRNLRLKVAWHIVGQLFWLLYLLLFFSLFRQQGQRQRGHRWVCPLIYYHFCRSTKCFFSYSTIQQTAK